MNTNGRALRDELPSGTVLGEYVIESAIGQGGFGVVYRARHIHLGTVIALKEYLPTAIAVRSNGTVCPRNQSVSADYGDGLQRFLEEARRLSQLRSHPGVVTCLGFFEERGTAYLAMEYQDGLPLSELLTKRDEAGNPLEERELLRLAEHLLESLAAVHSAGVLHRDIKPSNILIRRSDDRPVLIDFGAAKDDFAKYTKSNAPHTPGYAAIEQMEADGELGPWTDLYGLGAVLWRIVAGGQELHEPLVPTDVLSRMARRYRGQEDPLPSAQELGAGRFSTTVLELIDKCLELEPRDRPTDCGELLRQLSTQVNEVPDQRRSLNEGKPKGGGVEAGHGGAKPVQELAVRWVESDRGLWMTQVALALGVAALLSVLGAGILWKAGRDALNLGRFKVETDPVGAQVKLLDRAEQYRSGMELDSGVYRVEVSKSGYETQVATVRHGVGPTNLIVVLQPTPQPSRPERIYVEREKSLAERFLEYRMSPSYRRR